LILAFIVLLGAPGFAFGTGGGISARQAGAATEGFRFLGEIPDSAGLANGNTSLGALYVDYIHRRALVWRGNVGGARVWDAYDLDVGASRGATRLGEVRIVAATADAQRFQINEPGTEPLMVIDAANSRLMYAARGAMYEVGYDHETFDLNKQTLSKWVARPHPGGIDHQNIPSGLGGTGGVQNAVVPLGISYYRDGDGPSLYVVARLDRANGWEALVVTGWDAAPGNGSTTAPEQRDRWAYIPSTCRRPANLDPRNLSLVMRSATALYITCDAGIEQGGAKGILRIALSKENTIAPGEMAPTGDEEFFPGIVGADVEAYGDTFVDQLDREISRIYVMARNVKGLSRRILIYDADAGGAVGIFPVVNPPDPPRNEQGQIILPGRSAGVVDPISGRWYFMGPDGLRFQEGRLSTVPQSRTAESDLEHPNDRLFVGNEMRRALRVDPHPGGGQPPRILVWHPSGSLAHPSGASSECIDVTKACWKVYEDTHTLLDVSPTVDEFTLNTPESEATSGAYVGTTSAYGVRARLVRGASTFWPSSIAVGSLEGSPANSPPSAFPNDWLTDPFYYHAGDCYARDLEVTVGRVFESVLDSDGLETDNARAAALAVDPEAHQKNADDDALLRRELAHPDPTTTTQPGAPPPQQPAGRAEPWEGCGRQFFETMSHPGMNAESNPEDGNLDFLGQRWPFETVRCDDEDTDEQAVGARDAGQGKLLPMAVSGMAKVECGAGRGWTEAASLKTMTRSSISPSELASLVTVKDVVTETSSVREPLNGLRSSASVVVKGLTLGGTLEIEEVRTEVTVHAPGYRRQAKDGQPAVDASREVRRTFLGLSVDGERLCAVCSDTQVVTAINTALGTFGYARAPEPEADFKSGTVKGTSAVVQKDRLQQSADLIMNKDDTSEWPALEIVVYRDAEQRGSGRWILQIGGVFSQAKFSVITRLDDELPPDDEEPPEELPDVIEDAQQVHGGRGGSAPGASTPGIPGTPGTSGYRIAVAVPFTPASTEGSVGDFGGSPGVGDVLRPIVEALKSLKGAVLLAGLWLVVFGPVYVARRRVLLHRAVSSQ
jgi:hypothetical protein